MAERGEFASLVCARSFDEPIFNEDFLRAIGMFGEGLGSAVQYNKDDAAGTYVNDQKSYFGRVSDFSKWEV